MKVEVYWNLHKKLYSVRHKGRVIAHLPFVTLKDVRWVVQPAGRRRVRREKKKHVHAFARGTWLYGKEEMQLSEARRRLTHAMSIMYNPYIHHKFVLRSAPDVQIEWSDYATLATAYHVTHDVHVPHAHIYNFKEPFQSDPDFERSDQGPRI
jgi:hypothetical protein